MHVWALGLSCETPAASGPPRLHMTTRELQTCTFERPGASNTPSGPPPFGPPPFGPPLSPGSGPPPPSAPHPSGPPPLREPTPSGTPPLREPHPFGNPIPAGPHDFRPPPKTKNWPNAVWPNSVNKKCQIPPNKAGQMRPDNFGQMWCWPNAFK